MRYVLIAFVVIPLVELYLLLWVGSLIGFWPTVAITVVTGVLGGSLAKREGMRVYRQWRAALDEMRAPETGIVEGVLVLLGGALLITPGVLTDITGLLLLVPSTRRPIAARVRRAVDARIASGQVQLASFSDDAPFADDAGARVPRRAGDTIETDGSEVE
ncbi:MAG TPA: FxsA family protein [Polyangiaceae bacterium]|nr:FxsA family protein [Polyangiaceae bacterium]